MFDDGRSKKVVFIAHCFLNQNAISDGTAVYPAAFREVIDFFLKADVGIVQMPCPELCCLGLDRGNIHGSDSPVVVENTRIRSAMKRDSSNGIIGADRSPNCGVETTSDNNAEIDGMGLFAEKISYLLLQEKIDIKRISEMDFKNLLPAKNRDELRQWLNDRIIQIESIFCRHEVEGNI